MTSTTRCSTRVRAASVALGVFTSCVFASSMSPRDARAQSAGAIAEGLFRDGKSLMDKKDYEHACPKFAESVRLDPSSGSALALAICYAAEGKTASAWASYNTAAALAKRDNRKDREAVAKKRAAELEPKLSRVTFDVAPETRALEGLKVKRDDLEIGSAGWSGGAVDPGSHDLVVSAPHKKDFTTKFSVDAGGAATTVKVPALEDEPAPPAPVATAPIVAQPPPPSPAKSSGFRTTGFVIGGIGIAGLAAGGVFGALAISDASDVKKKCPGGTCTSASAVSEDHTTGTFADISTVAMAAGAVGLVVGAIFVLASPSGKDEAPPANATNSVTWHPLIGVSSVGVGGTF